MPAHNGATVYTNAPKRLREAVFADLCTLLRPHGMAARATGRGYGCTRTRYILSLHMAARATGRGHGSRDIDGSMAPVMPGRSNLTPTPPGR